MRIKAKTSSGVQCRVSELEGSANRAHIRFQETDEGIDRDEASGNSAIEIQEEKAQIADSALSTSQISHVLDIDSGSLSQTTRAIFIETPCPELHPFQKECTKCNAIFFEEECTPREKYTTCCKHGAIRLPSIPEPLEGLRNLLSNESQDHHHFMENITYYNNSLIFGSIGVETNKFTGRGPLIVCMNGKICNFTGFIEPKKGKTPSFAQLYVVDQDFALEERSKRNKSRRMEILKLLGDEIQKINIFAKSFSIMRDVMERERVRLRLHESEIPSMKIWLVKSIRSPPRRYNLPNSNEIAIVFRSQDGEPRFEKDIAIHPKFK